MSTDSKIGHIVIWCKTGVKMKYNHLINCDVHEEIASSLNWREGYSMQRVNVKSACTPITWPYWNSRKTKCPETSLFNILGHQILGFVPDPKMIL